MAPSNADAAPALSPKLAIAMETVTGKAQPSPRQKKVIAASRNGAEIGIHAIAIELANAIKQPARTIVAASTRVAADLASDAPSIVPLTATAGKHPTKAGLK
jgi:hypothetical protein